MRLLYNKICGTQQKLYLEKIYSFKWVQRLKLKILGAHLNKLEKEQFN